VEGLLGADTLASMLRIATPLTLAGLGGLLCQRAGVFNIALEGFMLVGAFASIAFVAAFGGSAWIGMLGAVAAGLLVAALFALSMVRFKANAIIAGIAVNLFALGLTAYLLRSAFGVQGRLHPANLRKLDPVLLPGIDQVPFLGQVVSGQSLMTWLSIALVVATQVLLFRTRKGLEICAVGQSEDAARTAGIDPDAIRLQVVLASGALCGLAGFYLSTEMVSQFSENMVQGRGFTAFTAVVFGGAHPVAVWLVTLLFGLADAVGIRIELAGTGIPPSIVKMFPFLLALLVLTVSSAAEQRRARGRSGPRKARATAG
jgi:general nucleoside transport system permease protein